MISTPPPQSRTTVFVTHAAPDDNEFALWLLGARGVTERDWQFFPR
jgi:hypothetical protein